LTITACVPTARGASVYQAKAAQTAEKMASAVATGELLATLAGDGKLLGPYASTAAADAEKEAEAIRSTFDGIQPPDQTSQDLGESLDQLLEPATSTLSEMRIVARQGRVRALAGFRDDLAQLTDELLKFHDQHG
jgi:hypothetical protein